MIMKSGSNALILGGISVHRQGPRESRKRTERKPKGEFVRAQADMKIGSCSYTVVHDRQKRGFFEINRITIKQRLL